jgi:hypothetical protein
VGRSDASFNWPKSVSLFEAEGNSNPEQLDSSSHLSQPLCFIEITFCGLKLTHYPPAEHP